jgi:hypothetical protein
MDRPPASPLEQSATRTYRYLRLTIVGLVVLLAVSVILASAQCGVALGSVSVSYYTPARSVFVGSLVGIGAALIALRGRQGVENALLTLGGMAAAVIALVPTPAPAAVGTCVAAPFDPGASVQNNIWALVAAGVFGLAGAALSTATSPRPGWRTWLAAVVLWVAVLLWFTLGRASFIEAAHYAASALLFVLLTVVAVINAGRARFPARPPLLPAAAYRTVYWFVAGAMAAAMLTAAVLWFALRSGVDTPGGWMLWLEAVLIGAFALFWLAQTAQYWHTGAPEPR